MRLSVRFGSGEFSDSEPGEVAVPIDHVTLDLERRHGAVGERLLVHRHLPSPSGRLGAAGNDLSADAVAGAGCGRLLRVAQQVGVFGGGGDPDMAEQPADRRQALAQGQGPGRVAVTQVMDPHVAKPGLLLDPSPVPGEAGQAGTGLGAAQHPGNAVGPLDTVQHLQHRPGQRHHARAGLRIAQPQHPRRPVDVVPFQGEDLVRPAAGQHQQAHGRDRRRHHRTLGLQLLQRSSQASVFRRRQEALSGLVAVLPDMAGRPAAGRDHPPVLGQHEHLRQDPDGLVGRCGPVPQLVMQRRHVLRSDILQGLLSQGGKDVVLDRQPVVLGRPGLAPHRDMVLETPFREIGDGRLGLRFRRERVLAPFDAVDDDGGLAPMLVDRLVADPPQGDPLQAGRPPGLDDVELAPGGVDTDAEAGKVAVPEDRVLAVGLEAFHNPLGQSERAPLRHRKRSVTR